jgi:hypothetical protein
MMPVPRAPHPGIPGPRPATHQAFFAAPQHDAVYTNPPAYPVNGQVGPALLQALHAAPTTSATGGTGDYWYMDSGASSHMTPYPGNLSASSPITTSSSIIIGNGHTLPITHTG